MLQSISHKDRPFTGKQEKKITKAVWECERKTEKQESQKEMLSEFLK